MITIDNTNCEFLISSFEGNKMFRLCGTLKHGDYDSYEKVYIQLCDQLNDHDNVTIMLNGTPLFKNNLKFWFKKNSTNTWSFNSNVPFCFTSCYNSIANCDAFASIIFTAYTNVSCYKSKTIKFCNPDTLYYITWKYSSIHVKHDNGKLINISITPGSYDMTTLVNTINKNMGVQCAKLESNILKLDNIQCVAMSGDIARFIQNKSTRLSSKNEIVKLGAKSNQIKGMPQTITTSVNSVVTFEFNKIPHIKNAMVCHQDVGIDQRISSLYVSDAAYKGVLVNQYKQLYFDIPSVFVSTVSSSVGMYAVQNWNCKTNDLSFVTVSECGEQSKIIVKNINNHVTMISDKDFNKINFGNVTAVYTHELNENNEYNIVLTFEKSVN